MTMGTAISRATMVISFLSLSLSSPNRFKVRNHLNVVRHVQLGWCRREEGGDVDAEQTGDWHVHGAQSSRGNAEDEPDAGHLVTLAASQGTETLVPCKARAAVETANE